MAQPGRRPSRPGGRSGTGRQPGGRSAPGGQARGQARGRQAAGGPSGTGQSTGEFTRPALAPGLLAAIVLLACIVLVGDGAFVFVRMAITVLALIILVFAVRASSVIGIVLAAVIAIGWNPVVTLPVPGQVWAALQIVAAAAFVALGILVKVPRES